MVSIDKRAFVVALLVIGALAGCGGGGGEHALIPGATPTPAAATLQARDLRYLGAFRVPEADANGFAFGGEAIGYDPVHNGLFMAGSRASSTLSMAEISISTPVNDPTVANLPRVTEIQPFADPTRGIVSYSNGTVIGGTLIDGNRLIVTVYSYYDARRRGERFASLPFAQSRRSDGPRHVWPERRRSSRG